MRYLIPWSGGFDSTAIILDKIAEGHSVDAIHMKFDNNEVQHRIERKAIRNLQRLISDIFGVDVTCSHVDMYGMLEVHEDAISAQPFLWATAIAWSAHGQYDATAFGYLRSSHVWHFRENFLSLIKNGRKMIMREKYKPLVVEFPFEWHDKQAAIEYLMDMLPANKIDLFMHTMYTCESPTNGKSCGKCNKCREISKVWPDVVDKRMKDV